MEDLDVIFLGSLTNSVPPVATPKKRQVAENYPGPNEHLPVVGFYGSLVPVGCLPQPVQESEAHNEIQGTSNTNQDPSTALPIPSSTSEEGLVTTEQNKDHPEPVPLRRNHCEACNIYPSIEGKEVIGTRNLFPFGREKKSCKFYSLPPSGCETPNVDSPNPMPGLDFFKMEQNLNRLQTVCCPVRTVKKVSTSNLIGPDGNYISPKISKTKRSLSKPDEPRMSKIQKVEKICPPKIKQPKPKPQAPKKQKIGKVEKVPPKTRIKQSIVKPPAARKPKIKKVEKKVPTVPLPKPKAPKKQKIQKVEEAATFAPPDAPTREDDLGYQRLLALLDANLVPSSEGADCPVCDYWVPPGNGVVLKNCLHSFCRKCLERAIQKSQTALVKCPFVCQEYECESHLQEREVKSLVSPEDYERHLARSVFQAQCQATNAFHCVMIGCNGWCLVDDIRSTWFACPVCMSKNCIPCRAIHNERGCPREDGLRFLGNVANKLERELQKNSENCSSSVHWKKALLTSQCSEDQPEDYRNLLELTDMGLVTNTEAFDCPICFSDIAIGEGVTLKECLHNYCRECLTGTIRHSDTFLVKCPFVNDEYSCESFIQEREIKSLLTPDEFERHLAMSLAQVERQSTNSFHCKTPDCAGWCLVEDDVNQFCCLVCKHFNCLSCAAIHEGKTCKQYQDMADLQNDEETKKYLKRQLKSNKAMACPTCQIIVMKRDGCDWIVCSMCQTEICWATKGPRWGPGGKGDTSGGCKCDFKSGKPCHRKCYNCH